ncbi:hypothetical protein [Prevotella sp. OH937_COT-195]|uniref:hypothetical protein n=1 Tax=Prevotella sp. OH937_COT-195 TaxID=2491051 RepID=UPI000F6503A6|nr:hypothetical protein [Prevotella sp. OH937_COT-195]RRC99465.1 hypothetical protein EII32_08060 [Prevotella sp. OH937_COT-195]
MRKILLSFAIMLLPAVAMQADEVVTVKTGATTTLFEINNIERINFDDETVTFVDKKGTLTPFNYDDISEITFDNVATGLESVNIPDAFPTDMKGGEVYSLSGHKMNGGTLPGGVYIIKKGTRIVKFVKR